MPETGGMRTIKSTSPDFLLLRDSDSFGSSQKRGLKAQKNTKRFRASFVVTDLGEVDGSCEGAEVRLRGQTVLVVWSDELRSEGQKVKTQQEEEEKNREGIVRKGQQTDKTHEGFEGQKQQQGDGSGTEFYYEVSRGYRS